MRFRKTIAILKNSNIICAMLFAFIILSFAITPLQAQTNIEVYGQNRMQYRKYDWKYFDTEHFRVYHYDRSGRQLARYVAEQAEKDITLIEKRLDGRFPKRLNIFLYNNYDEYRQTNVGRQYEGQLQGSAGTVDIVADKLVVYYTGIHTDLRRQLRAGMSQVILERMQSGENFREIVKNSVLQTLPKWVNKGYIAFMVDGWNAPSETDWKNLLEAQPDKGFYELANVHPELAGKAFWKYISDTRGTLAVKNLLYTFQQRNNINQGMKQGLGIKVKDAYDSVMVYYKSVFALDSLSLETPAADSARLSIPVPTGKATISQIRVSPKNADVAFVEFENGEYKVVLQRTTNSNQRAVIMNLGRKDYNEMEPDPNYPILAWSNSGYKLAILYKKNNKTNLRIYDAIKASIQNIIIPEKRFDRALGITFNEDDDKIVISAIKNSQTDLYNLTIKRSRIENITDDLWDDVQPTFVSGGSRRGILFLSNRPVANLNVPLGVNELPTGPMNLFFYDTKTKRTELLQCTFEKQEGITQPIQYGPDNFAYLNDQNGVRNKYVVVFARTVNNLDSPISIPTTNYSRSLLNHQYNPASNSVADVLQMGDHYRVFTHSLRIPSLDATGKTLVPTTLQRRKPARSAAATAAGMPAITFPKEEDTEPATTGEVIPGGNVFQSEFSDTTSRRSHRKKKENFNNRNLRTEVDTTDLLDVTIKDSTYVKLRSKKYRYSFKPDFFSLRLDNSVLFNRYQSVDYNNGGYVNPDLGAMLNVSLNDALEDLRLTDGLRIQPDQNFTNFNPTYFLQYENFKRRWDWSLLYLRTERLNNYEVTYTDTSGNPLASRLNPGKVNTNLIQGSVYYPIDRIRRIGLHLGMRQDNLHIKSIDTLSLGLSPTTRQYWMLSRAEYVFDNSNSPEQNIHVGSRYKFYGEYLYKLNEDKGGLYNLGMDFRYYLPIYKNTILATRIAYAHSGGLHKVLYYMGGVDNWLNVQQAVNPPISSNENYSFQAVANSMRGYKQGARNGNSFGVINMEVRSPLLSTIFKRPIQSNLLRSLQLIAFTDFGTAWDGILPNVTDNTKKQQLPGYPTSAVINAYGSAGLAMGFGPGIRAQLLGYYLRLDAAWNIEGIRKPVLYFGLGTDF